MRLLEFIFQDLGHFIGTVILLGMIITGLCSLVEILKR